MKILKSLVYLAAADILSLFIGLTLASSSLTVIRVICAVCTSGILVCFIASYAVRSAYGDRRNERISGKKISRTVIAAQGGILSLPPLVSWILLYISHSTDSFDFYRWHKLINGFFLQIYNLINSDASVSALNQGQIFLMLVLVPIPMICFFAAYTVAYRKERGASGNE
ncbi:MAG: hypothetical protein ACI4JE_04325 [Ruminococcus sp.]